MLLSNGDLFFRNNCAIAKLCFDQHQQNDRLSWFRDVTQSPEIQLKRQHADRPLRKDETDGNLRTPTLAGTVLLLSHRIAATIHRAGAACREGTQVKILQTNVAIIGAGTAGLAAYRSAIAAGASVLLIEGGAYGTTCARVGCMPSKLLIAAAEAAHTASTTAGFGVHLDGNIRVDGREVMDRVRSERDRFVGFVLESVDGIPADHRIRGYARFVDNNIVVVDDKYRIHADSIVIATGSQPNVLPMFESVSSRTLVNDDVFEWTDLPKSVVVVGAGVIGLELGQALSRLGVRVSILGARERVGPLTDPGIIAYSKKVFAGEFHFESQSVIQSVEPSGDGVEVIYQTPDGIRTDSFEHVVAATGRRPNLARLGLEATSMRLDAKGIPAFDAATLQVHGHPVFMAGDANGVYPLLHEAADEGQLAGSNAALFPVRSLLRRRTPITVVFTDPEIAMVGARFIDLVADEIVTGVVSFENQGRSRVMRRNRGLMHLYAEKRTGRFLGAEWMGPAAEHIAHLLSWSIQMDLTVEQMLEMPFYHPVIEEGVRTALRDAAAKLG